MVSIWKMKRNTSILWMQEIRNGMKEKGINDIEWIDREEGRMKIKFEAQKEHINTRI